MVNEEKEFLKNCYENLLSLVTNLFTVTKERPQLQKKALEREMTRTEHTLWYGKLTAIFLVAKIEWIFWLYEFAIVMVVTFLTVGNIDAVFASEKRSITTVVRYRFNCKRIYVLNLKSVH